MLQIKTSKIINDMAKVQQKSEKISAFGGIFFVLDRFDRILSSVIDSHLGLRSKLIGYQYSEEDHGELESCFLMTRMYWSSPKMEPARRNDWAT